MYRTLDEEVFLAPESIIWSALRAHSDWDEAEEIDELVGSDADDLDLDLEGLGSDV